MKTILLIASAAALAAPAFAQSAGGIILTNPEFGDGFKNRGQCESALAGVRNDQRKNADTRGAGYQDLSGSEFNQASRMTTRCENVDGTFQVVFNANGFAN